MRIKILFEGVALYLHKLCSRMGLCVKAVTEPDSAESTEITDRTRTESTEYNGKIRFSDTGF